MAMWTDHDINVLKDLYKSSPKEEIIEALEVKRRWNTIRAKALSLGLTREQKVVRASISDKEFSLHKLCVSDKFKGVIYETDDNAIATLSDIQKLLINEIKRYCEENGKFPAEKDMSNEKGYVSRTQYYKHFNSDSFTSIYAYIYKVEEKMPHVRVCSKCFVEKELNSINFAENKNSKFGLKTICKKCENWESIKRAYRDKGIVFESFTDISPETWWEYYHDRKIHSMPEFCYEKENIIRIVRYVTFEKMGIKNKQDLRAVDFLNDELLRKYNIYYLYRDKYSKYDFINMCFPEFEIKMSDMPVTYYTEDLMLGLISELIADLSLSVYDILDGNYNFENHQKMKSMVAHKFKDSSNTMFEWYFDKKDLLHPDFDRKIDIFDFKHKPNNFYDDEENRAKVIERYCIERGINEVIYDRIKLKQWINDNFKQPNLPFSGYRKYYDSLYDMIVDGMPIIKKESLLSPSDFYTFVAKDGTVCDSSEEVLLYEYMKYDMRIENVQAVGTSRSGEHWFQLPENHIDKRYFPDFVIEDKVNKPIYIEYFGLYAENPKDEFLQLYHDRTLRKNEFYQSLKGIRYVDLYPEDMTNDFQGVRKKVSRFISAAQL